MARPGLHNHPKFRRLVQLLKQPTPHVRGYLECMWDVAYECGNPYLGDGMDVELAAQWPGEPGKLTHALAACRLIDPVEHATAVSGGQRQPALIQGAVEVVAYQVHDLFHHAPDYVKKRHKRESQRKSSADNDTDQTVAAIVSRLSPNGSTPAPAPAPAPAPIITPKAPATAPAVRNAAASPPADDGDDVDFKGDFSRGWKAAQGKLSAMGATRWREAIEDAKGNGCTPGHVMELLAHAKAHGYQTGAVVYRVSRARMTLPVEEGWPPKPPDAAADERAKANRADREKSDELDYQKAAADSALAAAEREKRFGPELDAMDPAEVAEMVKPHAGMAKLFRKGNSPLVRAWLLVELQKRSEILS